MRIYPIPSSGSFTVDLSGINGKAKFILLDTSGHELYNAELPGQDATKLEYNLSPGIYVVLVEDGITTIRQKLIIQ